MDGVLVDSEGFICKAAIAMFKERGIDAQSTDSISFCGKWIEPPFGCVTDKYNLNHHINKIKSRTYAIYENITRGKMQPLEGVVAFIERSRQKGLKIIVATGTDKIKIEINLREIGLSV